MATINSTVTPLMLAAANGLMQNYGFNLNADINSEILTYTDAYVVTPASVGLTPNGTLGTDGVSVYDIEFDGNGNVVSQTNLGLLTSIIPGGWMIDGVLYNGSLSGFGGMVAERISAGYSNVVSYGGRYRNYYGNLTAQNLGANVLPAITQTVPETVSEISGSTTYNMDRQINLVMGSTVSNDVSVIISTLGQASGLIQQANTFLSAARTAEDTNLDYYGYDSYRDFIGQGWLKYTTGTVLVTAFNNIGTMTDSIFTGKFGTPGAVAYVLLGRGLGSIGDLEARLVEQGVNVTDIMNDMYTDQISKVLLSINNIDDLVIIQETIESTIPAMTSALDYIDISKCAGGATNDSAFTSFAEIGVDLYSKSPHITIERGSNISYIIQNLMVPSSTRVEELSTPTSLLSSSVTDSIRNQLPRNPTDTTLTVFDVVGSASGYYAPNLAVVNSAIGDLDATWYGPHIRANLQLLLNFTNNANVILGSNVTVNTTPYYTLMNTIVANTDPTISNIVNVIDTNYDHISSRVGTETYNWNLLEIRSQGYSTSTGMLSFATALPAYLNDPQGVGTYEFLTMVTEDNQTGDVIKSIFAEAKNYTLIQQFGLTPNGYIG